MNDVSKIIRGIDGFVGQVLHSLGQDSIDVANSEMDHVCYRFKTDEEFDYYQREMAALGSKLSVFESSKRLITTYKLTKPVKTNGREIWVVEFFAPKPGIILPSGFDHAEFVIEDPFKEFMSNYPQVQFDTGHITQPGNSYVAIGYDGFSVKFHHQSLESVISKEKPNG